MAISGSASLAALSGTGAGDDLGSGGGGRWHHQRAAEARRQADGGRVRLLYGIVDTDDGVAATHGNLVFRSALAVSRAYDVIDLKIAAAGAGNYFSDVIEAALQDALRRPDLAIGAVNLSFGGPGYPFAYADEIALLAARGMLCVARPVTRAYAARSSGRSIRRPWPR